MAHRHYEEVYTIVNGKEVLMKNHYGWYSAEYIEAMKLPRCLIDVERKPNWYSSTQCKKIKMPVQEGEQPVACSRAMHGYYLVYERDYDIPFNKL